MPVYPKEYLQSAPSSAVGTCFVIMPFSSEFDVVHSTIEAACTSPDLQLACRRADDISRGGHIMEDVLRGIVQAEFVVADLTGKNPNVFYELGIAHCCKDVSNVVMLAQDSADVPFDLRGIRHIIYRHDSAGLRKLKADLIEAMHSNVYRFSIEQGGAYELEEMLSGRDRYLYKFKMSNAGFGQAEAKFTIGLQKFIASEGLRPVAPVDKFISVGNPIKIEPTTWQLRLERIEQGRAYFSIARQTS